MRLVGLRGADPVHDMDRSEEILRELLARSGEVLEERGEYAGRHVRTDNLAVLVDTDLLVREDVLQLDLVVVAAQHLGDAHALAGPVAEPRLLTHEVPRRADLFANRA